MERFVDLLAALPGEGGTVQPGPSFPPPRFTWARSTSTKSDAMHAPPPRRDQGQRCHSKMCIIYFGTLDNTFFLRWLFRLAP